MNNDTAIVITDKNFLLISSHFTSKSPGYENNSTILYEGVNEVISSWGSDKVLKIIIGVDANHFIE